MIEIKPGVLLYKKDVTFQASKSSGPGGQHVNKVSSRIVLSYPLDKISGLSEKQQNKIYEKLSGYIVKNDIRVSSQKYRSQYSNKLDAFEKLKSLLIKALKESKPRIKTKIPRSVIEKRLKLKNKRSELKRDRNIDLDKDS